MGNLVQCCQTLSNYFKCQDAPRRGEAERSPLLSTDESECSSPDDFEDDMLTISTGLTNPALEPEHFLFPDIILSSNLGGDVAVVEPMVCLLVSEEEGAGAEGVDELGGEAQERPDRRDRGYSEVETQTELEVGTGVQTQTESQTEVQTQTEMLVFKNEITAREEKIQINTFAAVEMAAEVWEDHEALKHVDTLLEAQTYTQASCDVHLDDRVIFNIPSETQKKRTDSQTRSDVAGVESQEEKMNRNMSAFRNEEDEQEELMEKVFTICLRTSLTELTSPTEEGSPQQQDTIQENVFLLQQHSAAQEITDFVDTLKKNTESVCNSAILTENNVNMDENTAAAESLIDIQMMKQSISNCEIAENFDSTQQSLQTNELLGHGAVVSDQNANENIPTKREANLSSDHTDQTADQIKPQENMEPAKREEDSEPCLQLVSESRVPQVKEEEEEKEDEMKQMTLFLVDRLFLAAPHVKPPPCQMEETPKNEGADKREQLSIRDIVDLQETSFTVTIQPPGTDSFELQVSGQMLVAELHQLLMDHELTCHRTCFSLQLGGAVPDSLTEMRSIEGIQNGGPIKVVDGSYSVRDARLHLRHVRDLLRSLDPTDAYNGVNGSSLSYLTFCTRAGKDCDSVGRRRASEKESVDHIPPEFILPGCKDRPLTPLHPLRDDWKTLQCLRVLTMSSWNPPPGNRKMHGDLMYLNVLTMEDRELNITSSTRGFYINQSTAFNFNPKPALPKILCHSLVELLSQVSPAFRKNFNILQKKRVQQHPYERIAAPFPVFTWIAPHGDHAVGCVRAEETHTSHMGQDEHTAGQNRDWNEELQGCRELPQNSLQERLHRQRSIFKTNSEFVGAAGRGAVAVVDGNIMPLNPGESLHMQMFIWNNLFFSLGFDISDHFQPLGGNAAAHAAANCDLRGIQAYASVDTEGLHTLGTAVVDYRGVRVIAQTIVPGILEKNQEQSVLYGSNDYGKTVFTHPRFVELLDKTSKALRIQNHQVLDHNNSPVDLCSGIETKGILGNDGRPYILDLLRTFPPDLNFQFTDTQVKTEDVPQECRSFGYPRQHRHSLATLRPELIEAFVQHRYDVYVKMVSQGLSQLEENQQIEDKNTECEKLHGATITAAVDLEPHKRQVIQEACEAVGSVSDSCFDIRFNPDVCCPGLHFPSACAEEVQKQRRLLWDAAAFLLSDQIPIVLRDCLEHTTVPMDGATLTSVLHQRGVNMRYLGTLLSEVAKVEEGGRLSHVQRISISEVIIRSAKHIFKSYLQDVEPAAFSAAVSHFLNCLLSSSLSLPDSCSDELLSRRRSRRRRSHGNRVSLLTGSSWARMTRNELWGRIRTEAEDYYHYTIVSESIDEVIEKYSLQRISLLREMAIKTGIQVQMREYVFESRHRPVFGEEDVVNMFPVVKHLQPTVTDATWLVQQAQEAVQQGLLKEGHELISQALTLFSSVCGVLHEDVCMCLRLLGRLSYILGDNADALSRQEKAVLCSERTQGIDHPQTIHDYTFLALYCFAAGQHSTSLQLLYRARYLTLLVSGEDHPQVALLDSMLGLVLHGLMEYELSLKFLKNALILTSKYHGAPSLKYAQSHHLLATVYESKGEFRSALQHEKETYSIYRSQVGERHDRTKESSEYLKSLTQQAVILQKAINQIRSNTLGKSIPPPKFSTPSFPTILQQLNLTCGIILIPLSAKDISDLRTEFRGKENIQVEELENLLSKQKDLITSDTKLQH